MLALLAAGAGCSSPQSAAEDVSTRFTDAVAESSWSTACGLLAPQTRSELEQSSGQPCSAALQAEELSDAGPVESFTAFGTMAQVRYAQDTVFVGEFEDGWKVVAAGCARVAGHPYDCQLQG